MDAKSTVILIQQLRMRTGQPKKFIGHRCGLEVHKYQYLSDNFKIIVLCMVKHQNARYKLVISSGTIAVDYHLLSGIVKYRTPPNDIQLIEAKLLGIS